MKKVKVSNKTRNENLYKKLSLFFGLSLLYISFKDNNIFKTFVGLLLLFYTTYEKNIYISEEGLTYSYNSLLFKREEHIKFQDTEDITIVKGKKNYTLFFIKYPIARKLIIDSDKLEIVLNLIKKGSNISIKFES